MVKREIVGLSFDNVECFDWCDATSQTGEREPRRRQPSLGFTRIRQDSPGFASVES